MNPGRAPENLLHRLCLQVTTTGKSVPELQDRFSGIARVALKTNTRGHRFALRAFPAEICRTDQRFYHNC